MSTFPTCIEEVTARWLDDSLRDAGGGGVITGFTHERIGEGIGLLGTLHRITLQWDGAADGTPQSVIGKFATDNPEALEVVAMFNFYEKEVNFYTLMADKTLTRTPACYAGAHDPASQTFVLLLEDASAGQMGDQVAGATSPQIEATVEELAKLHASWWGSQTLADTPWILDYEHPIYTEGIPQALDQYHPISSKILDMPSWYDQYRATVNNTLERLAAMPWTLVHGDARLDNLFFEVGEDPLLVIDWQLILRGAGISDIAYFMSQSVPISLRRERDSDVVTHYHDRLVELGVHPPTRQELWDAYRLTTALCLVYPTVGGGTVDPDDERAVDLVRSMLDRCVTASEDLDAVSLLT